MFHLQLCTLSAAASSHIQPQLYCILEPTFILLIDTANNSTFVISVMHKQQLCVLPDAKYPVKG